jgi:hypothetical protein
MKTITEVIQVSLRLGQTILRPSARTWLANCGIEVRRGFGGDGGPGDRRLNGLGATPRRVLGLGHAVGLVFNAV